MTVIFYSPKFGNGLQLSKSAHGQRYATVNMQRAVRNTKYYKHAQFVESHKAV